MKNTTGAFICGLVAGGLIGATAGMLVAQHKYRGVVDNLLQENNECRDALAKTGTDESEEETTEDEKAPIEDELVEGAEKGNITPPRDIVDSRGAVAYNKVTTETIENNGVRQTILKELYTLTPNQVDILAERIINDPDVLVSNTDKCWYISQSRDRTDIARKVADMYTMEAITYHSYIARLIIHNEAEMDLKIIALVGGAEYEIGLDELLEAGSITEDMYQAMDDIIERYMDNSGATDLSFMLFDMLNANVFRFEFEVTTVEDTE